MTDGECSDCSPAIESPDYNRQANQVQNHQSDEGDAIEKEPHFAVDLELPHPDQYLPETGLDQIIFITSSTCTQVKLNCSLYKSSFHSNWKTN